MTRVTFTIGQGFDAAGRPLADLEVKRSAAFRHVALAFGGFFAHVGNGGWVDGSGRLILESALTISSYIESDALGHVDSVGRYLQTLFCQESILIARETADVAFTAPLAINESESAATVAA